MSTVFSRQFGPVTRTDIVRYAGAGGDFNPIHHDDFFAQKAGYPTVFAHGLYTAGLVSTAIVEQYGPLSLRRFSVRYTGQVWPGDLLQVTAQDAGERDGNGHCHLEITVEAIGEGEESRRVLTGSATVDVEGL